MIILWRTLLIIACCFAVIICYPHYANGAITIMITWAVIAFFTMLGITLIAKALLLGKSHVFNSLLDIAIIIGFLYILLNIFVQIDGTTPYNRIKKNIYPTSQDIRNGLKNIGLNENKKALNQLQQNINEVSNNLEKVKTIITKEHKD